MEAVKKKLQDELDALEDELHFKLPKEIQKAREFGDLRENAEYKAAMERQSIVQARIMQVRQRLGEVESIDLSKIPTDRVAYGSHVVLSIFRNSFQIKYIRWMRVHTDPTARTQSTCGIRLKKKLFEFQSQVERAPIMNRTTRSGR